MNDTVVIGNVTLDIENTGYGETDYQTWLAQVRAYGESLYADKLLGGSTDTVTIRVHIGPDVELHGDNWGAETYSDGTASGTDVNINTTQTATGVVYGSDMATPIDTLVLTNTINELGDLGIIFNPDLPVGQGTPTQANSLYHTNPYFDSDSQRTTRDFVSIEAENEVREMLGLPPRGYIESAPDPLTTPHGIVAPNGDFDSPIHLPDIPSLVGGLLGLPSNMTDPLSCWGNGQQASSPLVIDLSSGHTGITLTSFDAATTATFFDIDGTGFAAQTAWTSGILVFWFATLTRTV